MTRRLLGVALAIAIGIIVIAVGQAAFQRDWFSPWRTAYLARPDIVEPQVGSVIASGDTYPVTVYEYLDRDNFIVSGRTITYSFSPSYYVDPLPPPGESVLNFGIAFDADTGGSWADAPKDLREPGADIFKTTRVCQTTHISVDLFDGTTCCTL